MPEVRALAGEAPERDGLSHEQEQGGLVCLHLCQERGGHGLGRGKPEPVPVPGQGHTRRPQLREHFRRVHFLTPP